MDFDGPRGLGTLRDDLDGTLIEFHCTAIVDGTRTIPINEAVSYEPVLTHVGRTEATRITRLDEPGQPPLAS